MPELRQRVGRLVFVGIPNTTLDAETRRILEDLQIGGVVLFRRNIGTPAEIAALTTELHALPSRPLVAIDHEGGRVARLGEPFTRFPPAASIGDTRDVNLAYRIGRAMAEELASVGIDMNFAPVLDVYSNQANAVIGDRAFGSDAALVADMGIATMRGLHDGGVIPCGKHFPGHGDTEADSHEELPIVRATRAELDRTELVPFRAAIAAGLPLMMSAHVLYSALDPDHPATLSRKILTDLLRDELHFGGVVTTDDLQMRAITTHHQISDAVIAALNAGADMVLVCQNLDQAILAHAAMERAAYDGVLSPQLVEAAGERMERLRASRPGRRLGASTLPDADHRALVEALRQT